jgi:hypothetical protein
MCVPGEQYQFGSRPFPAILPPVLYDTDDIVQKVDVCGKISSQNCDGVENVSRNVRMADSELLPCA